MAIEQLEPDDMRFKRAMASFPSGVTVVTTYSDAGDVVGFTASAFSSLSMDPPLILVCPAKTSRTYPHILSAGQFAVHVLAGGQADMAYLFAKSGSDVSHLPWRRSNLGNPLLDGAVCTIECRLRNDYDGGDHAILVGEVLAIDLSDVVDTTLLYLRGTLASRPH